MGFVRSLFFGEADTVPLDTNTWRGRMRQQLYAFDRAGSVLGLFIAACIFCYVLAIGMTEAPHRFALLCIVAACAAAIGGCLGFIFGIPRIMRQNDLNLPPTGATQKAAGWVSPPLAGNTNLEEISDWLTKIIIGVGLVQALKFYDSFTGLASRFQRDVIQHPSAAAFFSALVLVSLAGGFLYFYLQTRTRITLLLSDAGNAVSLLDSELEKVVSAVNKTPIRVGDDKLDIIGNFGGPARRTDADKKLFEVPFEELNTPESFAAWASAQARSGNLKAAFRAIQEAVSRDPSNYSYLEKYGDIRHLEGVALGAVTAYIEARSKAGDVKTKTRIIRKELLACLYIPAPEGYRRALALVDTMADYPALADDAMVQIWIAAAYGQKASWLKANAGSQLEIDKATDDALSYVKRVTALIPDATKKPRQLLRLLFDPSLGGAKSRDDDLYVFFDDLRFKKEILETA